MVVYQFRAQTFPETEISYLRFFSGTRKRNVKKRDFRFFYYLDMIWAYLWPSRLNITPSSSQPNLNLPSSQSRNPSILLIKKRFFSVYPETKRNDCYISGTRKETTFFNGRLSLETGTKREWQCRFHGLCLKGVGWRDDVLILGLVRNSNVTCICVRAISVIALYEICLW